MKVWIDDRWTYSSGALKGEKNKNWGKGLRWRVVWIDPTTRKEKSQSFPKLKGSGGADEFQTKIENSLRSGVYLDPRYSALSFREVSDQYRAAQHDSGVGTRTVRDREFAAHVLPKWGERPLGSITRANVEGWVQELLAGTAPFEFKRKRTPKALAASSTKHLVQHVSGVFAYAMEHDWIARNPARGVTLPKALSKDQKFLSIAQVETVAATAEKVSGDHSDAVLVLLLAYGGVRIGEAMALLVSDLDSGSRRLSITKTWKDDAGKAVLGPPKNGKNRKVPVHGFLLPELLALTEAAAPSDYLFRAPRGGALSTHNWRSRVWKKMRLELPFLADMTPHDLRHTAASTAIAVGADVLVVQTMLGHSSATETLDTYGHLFPDRLDEVASAVEAKRAAVLGPPSADAGPSS